MLYKILARSVGRVYLLVYIIDTCCIRYYQDPWGRVFLLVIYNRYMLYKILARSVGRVYLLVYIIDICCIRYLARSVGRVISYTACIYNIYMQYKILPRSVGLGNILYSMYI